MTVFLIFISLFLSVLIVFFAFYPIQPVLRKKDEDEEEKIKPRRRKAYIEDIYDDPEL